MPNVFGESSESDSEPQPPPTKKFKAPIANDVDASVINCADAWVQSNSFSSGLKDSDGHVSETLKSFKKADGSSSPPESLSDIEDSLYSRQGLGDKSDNTTYNQKSSLNKSILDEGSIGYRIMQKMGYKPGQTIGSSKIENALVEPLSVRARPARTGIGESPFTPKTTSSISPHISSTFQEAAKTKHENRGKKHLIAKLQKFCLVASGEDLKFEQGVFSREDVNPLWRDCISSGLDVKKRTVLFGEESNDPIVGVHMDGVNGPKAEIAQSPEEMEAKLTRLLEHTRGRYYYCPFCGISYDDETDLRQNCPGPTEQDHQF